MPAPNCWADWGPGLRPPALIGHRARRRPGMHCGLTPTAQRLPRPTDRVPPDRQGRRAFPQPARDSWGVRRGGRPAGRACGQRPALARRPVGWGSGTHRGHLHGRGRGSRRWPIRPPHRAAWTVLARMAWPRHQAIRAALGGYPASAISALASSAAGLAGGAWAPARSARLTGRRRS